MGQWNMTILGHGIHDNHREDDADAMLTEFVKALEAKGHEIEGATFTVGSTRDVKASV